MKEKLPINYESKEVDYGENDLHEKLKHHQEVNAETAPRIEHEDIEKLSKKVHEHARSSSDILDDHSEQTAPPAFQTHSKHPHTASQTLNQAQRRLKPLEQKFSHVIHNPAVDTASNIAGGTVARPSGLLWGGIFSLIGSIGVIVICRYYGYEYNYLIGLASFAGGFIVGLILEAGLKLVKR